MEIQPPPRATPLSSHIASNHWVMGTLSKARGKRVVKHVSLRAETSSLEPSGAFTRLDFWVTPISLVRCTKTGFSGSSLGAKWFTESLIFEWLSKLLNVFALWCKVSPQNKWLGQIGNLMWMWYYRTCVKTLKKKKRNSCFNCSYCVFLIVFKFLSFIFTYKML